jgi:ABC-2 type transport system ATP-binding protein
VEVLLGLCQANGGKVRVLGGAAERAVGAGRVGGMLQRGGLPDNARVGEARTRAEAVDIALRKGWL